MNLAITIVTALIQVYYVLILIRLLISWFPNVDQYNPAIRLLRRVVDPFLAPFRRIVPSMGGLDFSPILAILVLFEVSRILQAVGAGGLSPSHELVLVIEQLVLDILIIVSVFVLLRLFVSLLSADQYHPVVVTIRQLSNPLVLPFAALTRQRRPRGVGGAGGGFDVAALVALVCYVAFYFIARYVFGLLLATV